MNDITRLYYYSAEEHPLLLNTTPSLPVVLPLDHDELALAEEDMVASILSAGCSCTLVEDGRCCSTQFTADYVLATQGEYRELSHAELDMAP